VILWNDSGTSGRGGESARPAIISLGTWITHANSEVCN
jgi:hypothetical protein